MKTDVIHVNATIPATATCAPKTKNALTSRNLPVQISYVPHYQFVSIYLHIVYFPSNALNSFLFEGRPKAIYANPCESGAPLTDDLSGAPVACALRFEDGTVCPANYECTAVAGSTQAVCCSTNGEESETEGPEDYNMESRPQTSKDKEFLCS